MENALQCQQEGEKRDADGEGGREYGLEEMSGALYRGPPTAHSLAKQLHVVVDDDDRIVNNHT